MRETPPPGPPADAGTRPRRKGPPAWGIFLFLLLLGGLLLLNQWATTGGEPIRWIENDLDAALKQAASGRKHVFLYLYDPNDPTHRRNEREVFPQRWAREPLQHIVSCRTSVLKDTALRQKYQYVGTPLFLLLNEKGEVVSRAEGALDEREFYAYIGALAARARSEPAGGPP
jgi:hypothetical protein